jgi:hypothetical protein
VDDDEVITGDEPEPSKVEVIREARALVDEMPRPRLQLERLVVRGKI